MSLETQLQGCAGEEVPSAPEKSAIIAVGGRNFGVALRKPVFLQDTYGTVPLSMVSILFGSFLLSDAILSFGLISLWTRSNR